MSFYWEGYCKTCKVSGGLRVNKGEQSVEAICRFHAAALAALYEAERDMRTAHQASRRSPFANTEISILYSEGIDLVFFFEHKGHDLCAIGEDGRRYGVCGRYERSANDKEWFMCDLDDHDADVPHRFAAQPTWRRS